MRKLAAVALLLALAAAPAAAQMIPRPIDSGPFNFTDLQKLLRRCPTRVVTVDSSVVFAGTRTNWPGCLYTSLAPALAYITAQTPTTSTPWTVLLMPGAGTTGTNPNYTESTLVVPPQTTIEGFSYGSGPTPSSFATAPILSLTCTAGSCMQLQGGDTLFNLTIRWTQTPTAAVKVVEVNGAGQGVSLANVAINVAAGSNAFAVDGVTDTVGSLYLWTSGVTMAGNALGRAVVNNSSSGITLYGPTRLKGSSGCATLVENTHASGVINLYPGVRLDAGCTADLKQTGAGPITAYPGVAYGPISGTITNALAHASAVMLNNGPTINSGTGAPEGALTAPIGSIYQRTDCTLTTTCFCVKESGTGNTGWICK